jgi:hypothetical protein
VWEYSYRVSNLQAAIAFEEDDTAACRAKLGDCPPDDPDIVVNLGCVLLKVRRCRLTLSNPR